MADEINRYQSILQKVKPEELIKLIIDFMEIGIIKELYKEVSDTAEKTLQIEFLANLIYEDLEG